jgi:hypothetical protein
MGSASGRSILIVASLQAAVVLAALASSPTAALAAAAIGLLAVGRFASVALFAATMGSGPKAGLRSFAGSAWALGLVALAAAIAAVAVKARPVLPWAIAAALAEPIGMSLLALGSGIGSLVLGRVARRACNRGGLR